MRSFDLNLEKYEGVEGVLKLQIPPYKMRLKMMQDCNLKTDDKGEVSIGADSIGLIIKLMDLSAPYFLEIDLKCGDIVAKSIEDMENNPEFDQVLTDAAMAVLNAGKLGE